MRDGACLAAILAILAGCAQTPPVQSQAAQQLGAKPACHAGSDAKGIAAGFFEFFQDDPGCF